MTRADDQAAAAGYSSVEEWEAAGWPHPTDPETGSPYIGYKIDRMERGRHPTGRKMVDEDWFDPKTQYIFDYLRQARRWSTHYEWADEMRVKYPNYPMPGINMDELLRQMFPDWYDGEEKPAAPPVPREIPLPTAETLESMIPEAARAWMVRLGMEVPEGVRRPPEDRALPIERMTEAEREEQRRAIREGEVERRLKGIDWAAYVEREERKPTTWREFLREEEPTPEEPPVAASPLWEGMGDLIERAKEVLTRPEITEPLPKPEEVAVGVGKILVSLPILPAVVSEALLGRLSEAIPVARRLAEARPKTAEKIIATSLLPADWLEYGIGQGMLRTLAVKRVGPIPDDRWKDDPKTIAEYELGNLLASLDDETREKMINSLARIGWSTPIHHINAARRLIDPEEYETWARYEGELVEIIPGTTLKEGYAPVDMWDPDVVTQILRQEEWVLGEFFFRTILDPLNVFYIPEFQQAPGIVWRRVTGAKTPAQRARQKLTAYYAAEGKEVPLYVEEFLKSAKGKAPWYQKAVANIVEDWFSPLASRYKAWKARGAPGVIMSLPDQAGDVTRYMRAAAKAEDEIARSYALVYPRAGTSDPNFLEVVARAMSSGLNPAQLREMRVLVIEAENYRAFGNLEGAEEKIRALEKLAKEGLPLRERWKLIYNLSRTKAGSMNLLRPTPAASREMMADDAIRVLGWMFEDMPSGIDRAVATLLLKKDPQQLVKEFPWINSKAGLEAFRILQHIRDESVGSLAFATGIPSTNIQGGWTQLHEAFRRIAGTYHYPSPRPDLWQRMWGLFYRGAPRTFLSTGRYPLQNISSNFTNIWARYGWVTPRSDASSLAWVNRFMGDAGFLPPGFARSITAAGEVSTERIPTLLGRKWVYEGPTTRGREAPSEEALAAAREVARGPSPVAWAKRLVKKGAGYLPFGEGWIDLSKWGERNASMANYRDVVDTIKGEFGRPGRGFLPTVPEGVEASLEMRDAIEEIIASSWSWGEVIEGVAKLYGVEVKPQQAHFVSTERIRNLGAEAIEVADDLMEALTIAPSKSAFQRRYRLIKKGVGKHVGEWIAAEPDFPEAVELPRAPLEGLTPEQAQRLMALTGTAERNRGHILNGRRILIELAEKNRDMAIEDRYRLADVIIDKALRDYMAAGKEATRMTDSFWSTINDGRLWPAMRDKINKMHATAHENIDKSIHNAAMRLGGDSATVREELELFPWGGLPADMADRKMRALQDDLINSAHEMQAWELPLAPEGVVTPPLDSIRAIKDWAQENPLAANAWLEYMQEAIEEKALAEAVEVVARTPAEEIKRARRASWREGTARQIELMEQKIARLQEEIATSPVEAADIEQLTTRQQELYGMAMELEGYKDTLTSLPTQKEVFRFWDYKEGDFRKVREPSGRVAEFAQSEIVQEIANKHYGLQQSVSGAEQFGEMIRQRLDVSNRIAALENLIWEEPELILPETAEGLEAFIKQSEPQLEQMMLYEREPHLFQTALQHYEEAVDRLAKIRAGEAMPESVVSKVENAKAEIAKLEREREAIRLATLQRNRIPASAEERVMLAQDLQALNEEYVAKGIVKRNRLGQGPLFEDLEELRERGFLKRTVRGKRKADKARAIPKIGYEHYFYTLTDAGRDAVKGISIVRMPETVPKPVPPGSRVEPEIPDFVEEARAGLLGQAGELGYVGVGWTEEILANLLPGEIIEAHAKGLGASRPPFSYLDRFNTPEEMIAKAREILGVTKDVRRAGFILEDGTLLDLGAQITEEQAIRADPHADVAKAIDIGEWNESFFLASHGLEYFIAKTGAMRVAPMPGFGGMGEMAGPMEGGFYMGMLKEGQRVTEAQRQILRQVVGLKPYQIYFTIYDEFGTRIGEVRSKEYPLVSQVDGLVEKAMAIKGGEKGDERKTRLVELEGLRRQYEAGLRNQPLTAAQEVEVEHLKRVLGRPPTGVPGVEAAPPVTRAEQAALFGAPREVEIPKPELPPSQLPGLEAGELFGGGEIPMEIPPEARERLPELPMDIEGLTPEAAEKIAMEEGAYRLPGVEPPAVAPEVPSPEEFMPEGYGERWQAQVESLIEVEQMQVDSRQFADGRQMTEEEHQRKVAALDALKIALKEAREKPGLVEYGVETTEELVIEGIEKGEEKGEATREVKAAILKAIGEGRTVRAKKAEGGRNYWNGFLGFETSGVDSLLTPEQFAKIRSGEIQVNGWPEYMPDQEYAKTFEAYRISREVATHRIQSDPRQRLQYSKEVLADLRGELEALGLKWEPGVKEGTFSVEGPEHLMEEAESKIRGARVKYFLPEPIPGVETVAPEVPRGVTPERGRSLLADLNYPQEVIDRYSDKQVIQQIEANIKDGILTRAEAEALEPAIPPPVETVRSRLAQIYYQGRIKEPAVQEEIWQLIKQLYDSGEREAAVIQAHQLDILPSKEGVLQLEQALRQKFPEGIVPEAAKEPWQMIYSEFFDMAGSEYTAGSRFGVPVKNRVPIDPTTGYREKGNLPEERIHRAIVRKALSEGKPVPPEVLAERHLKDLAPEVPTRPETADQILEEINATHASLQALRGTGQEAQLKLATDHLAQLGEQFRAAGGMEAVKEVAVWKIGQDVIVVNTKLIPSHIDLKEGEQVTIKQVRPAGAEKAGYVYVEKPGVAGAFDPKAFGPVTVPIEPRVAAEVVPGEIQVGERIRGMGAGAQSGTVIEILEQGTEEARWVKKPIRVRWDDGTEAITGGAAYIREAEGVAAEEVVEELVRPKPELPRPAEILREKGVLPAYEPPAVDMDEVAEWKARALDYLHRGREHGDMRILQNADHLYMQALEEEHSIPPGPDEPKEFEIPSEVPKSRQRDFQNLVRVKYQLSFLYPRLEALLELERSFSEAQGMTPVGRGADPVWEDLLAHVPEEFREEIQPYAFLPDHLQPLSYMRTLLFDVDWRLETAEKKLADLIERLPKKWKKLGRKIEPTLADLAKPPEAPEGIPTMITHAQREILAELGYSEAMINQMTPEQAQGLVQGRLKDFAPPVETPFGPMADLDPVMPPSPREGAELKRDLLIERMEEWYKQVLKVYGKEIESDPSNFGNVNQWLENDVRAPWGQMKIYMDKMGEATTAWTLYNYRKLNIDTLMYRGFWWPYWQTRTGHRWLSTFLQNPAKLALWARWHDTHRKINEDLPENYRDTVHIPDWVPVIGGQHWNPYFFFDPIYAWMWSLDNFVPTWKRDGLLSAMVTSTPVSPLLGMREWLQPMITEEGRRMEPVTPWSRALYEKTGINIEASAIKGLETLYGEVKPSIYSAMEKGGAAVGRPGLAERVLGGPGVMPIITEGRYRPTYIVRVLLDMWLAEEITEDEFNEAMSTREGPIWTRAIEEVKRERGLTEFSSIYTGIRARRLHPSEYEIEEFKRQRAIIGTMEEGPEKREYREQFYDNFPWGRQYDVRYDSVESARMEATISEAWMDIENEDVISEKKLADAIRSRPGDLAYEYEVKQENREREETKRAFWMRQGVSFIFNPRTRTYEEIEDWVSGQILGQFYYHLPQADRFRDEEGAIDWDAYNEAVEAFWEDLPRSIVKWEDIVRMDQEVSDSIGTKVNVLSLAQEVATEEAYDEWRRANDIPEEALNYVWKKYIIDVANEFYQDELKDLEYDERNMPAFFAEFGHKTGEELIPYILKEYPGMWTEEELTERLAGMTMPGIWERWNQDGDERSTAISLLWAFWGGQTGLGRRRMKELLNSPIYNQYFVDKKNRNYERITNEELEGWLKELKVSNPWDDNDGALRTLYYWTVDSTGDPLLYKDEEPEARGRAPGLAAPSPFEPPTPEEEEPPPPQPLRTIPQLAGTSESAEYARAQDEMSAWVAAGKEGDWTPLMEKWFGKDTPAGFFWEYYWAEIPPGRIADEVRKDPIIEMLLSKAFRTVYEVKGGVYEAALETLQAWREAHPELPGDPKEWAIVRQIVKKYWELREAGAQNEARAIWMYFAALLEPYYPSTYVPKKRKPMPAYMRRGRRGRGGGRGRGTFPSRWRRWANIRYYPSRR